MIISLLVSNGTKYQLPEFIPSNSDSGLHSCNCAYHSTYHLGSRTYPLPSDLHWHQYTHLYNLYWLQIRATSTYKWLVTLYMLPFIPLHFLCIHFWQLVHCIELLRHLFHIHHTAILQILHWLLTFSTYYNPGFTDIYFHTSILFIILPFISLLIKSSSVSARDVKRSSKIRTLN